DPERLRSSVASVLRDYNSSLTTSWITECQRYQTEHGVADCLSAEGAGTVTVDEQRIAAAELFRTWLTSPRDNARNKEQLLSRMTALQSQMDESPVTAELARRQYAMLR